MNSYEVLNAAQECSETDPFTLERYQQFFRHLPYQVDTLDGAGLTVLDVGCNTGRGGRLLKQLKPSLRLIGLDCVPARLDQIQPGIYEQKLCASSTAIALPPASVDAILAGEFIEHLYPVDVRLTLDEFYRILRPGGQLLLTTPNPNYWRLRLTGGSVLGGAHVSQHYPRALKQQLEQLGMGPVQILGSGKMSRYLGEFCPVLALYGSYLVVAQKPL